MLDRDGVAVLRKVWTNNRTVHGKEHYVGEPKRTWEVIADAGMHSYNIVANPKYRVRLI